MRLCFFFLPWWLASGRSQQGAKTRLFFTVKNTGGGDRAALQFLGLEHLSCEQTFMRCELNRKRSHYASRITRRASCDMYHATCVSPRVPCGLYPAPCILRHVSCVMYSSPRGESTSSPAFLPRNRLICLSHLLDIKNKGKKTLREPPFPGATQATQSSERQHNILYTICRSESRTLDRSVGRTPLASAVSNAGTTS